MRSVEGSKYTLKVLSQEGCEGKVSGAREVMQE
jgi:hypothetical protein